MKTVRIAVIWVAVIVLATPSRSVLAQPLPAALSQLTSSDYTVRRGGFYRIFSLANSGAPSTSGLRPHAERLAKYAHDHPEVASALISLLERENLPDPAKNSSSEDSYYGDLIGCVAQMKDPRAINALMGAIETGDMATQGLAALGDAAAPNLLRAVRSGPRVRLSALVALSEMVSLPNSHLSSENRSGIRSTLLSVLKDENRYVRMTGLDGLAYFSDSAARRAVQEVTVSDSFVLKRNGRKAYPVRALAIVTLRKQDSLRVRQDPH